MWLYILLYASLGAVTGLVSGLLGIGGGLIVVPMLHLAFNFQGIDPGVLHKLSLGTSMTGILFTSVSSSLAHNRHGGVDWKTVARIAPGILLGTYCGTFVAARMPAQYLQIVFVAFLSYVIFSMFSGGKPKPSRHLPGTAGLTAAGGGIGLLSSLVGIGGGTMSVPYLLWHNVDMRRAIGTSAAIGFPIALSGGLGYIVNGWGLAGLPEWSLGYVYLPGLLGLVSMSMLVAPLGARLAQKLPVPTLKKCFAFLLVLVAIKMLLDAVLSF